MQNAITFLQSQEALQGRICAESKVDMTSSVIKSACLVQCPQNELNKASCIQHYAAYQITNKQWQAHERFAQLAKLQQTVTRA